MMYVFYRIYEICTIYGYYTLIYRDSPFEDMLTDLTLRKSKIYKMKRVASTGSAPNLISFFNQSVSSALAKQIDISSVTSKVIVSSRVRRLKCSI